MKSDSSRKPGGTERIIACYSRARGNKAAAFAPPNSGHVVISPIPSTGYAADAKFKTRNNPPSGEFSL
jgi:hypothetical protein